MRKLGLMLGSILILGAFMALSAVPALAGDDDPVWATPRCGPDPYKQEVKVYDFFFRTDNPYEREPSAYHGGGKICGPWAMRVPAGGDPLNYGADTFATGWGHWELPAGGAEIWVPYGVRVDPTIGDPRSSNNDYMGQARVSTLTWANPFLGYQGKPSILENVPVPLRLDKTNGGLGLRQINPSSENPNDRKGCLRDSDLPDWVGDPNARVIVCVKGDLLGLAQSWISTVRYNMGAPEDSYLVSIGELFGVGGRYASLTEIVDFFQCERIGGQGTTCGAPGRPNVHYNGYADDEECSLGNGLYWAGVYFRNGNNPWTSACSPWRVRP